MRTLLRVSLAASAVLLSLVVALRAQQAGTLHVRADALPIPNSANSSETPIKVLM